MTQFEIADIGLILVAVLGLFLIREEIWDWSGERILFACIATFAMCLILYNCYQENKSHELESMQNPVQVTNILQSFSSYEDIHSGKISKYEIDTCENGTGKYVRFSIPYNHFPNTEFFYYVHPDLSYEEVESKDFPSESRMKAYNILHRFSSYEDIQSGKDPDDHFVRIEVYEMEKGKYVRISCSSSDQYLFYVNKDLSYTEIEL